MTVKARRAPAAANANEAGEPPVPQYVEDLMIRMNLLAAERDQAKDQVEVLVGVLNRAVADIAVMKQFMECKPCISTVRPAARQHLCHAVLPCLIESGMKELWQARGWDGAHPLVCHNFFFAAFCRVLPLLPPLLPLLPITPMFSSVNTAEDAVRVRHCDQLDVRGLITGGVLSSEPGRPCHRQFHPCRRGRHHQRGDWLECVERAVQGHGRVLQRLQVLPSVVGQLLCALILISSYLQM